ncbi:MAG: ABC transporter permease subunit [Clostridia bacterium]|nr:ABC transporter permease subunit [Clostridia bacterium]
MKGSKRTKAIFKNAVWGLCALLFLSLLWLLCYVIIGDDTVVAAPWATVGRAFLLLGESGFWSAFFATLLRALLAFLIAAILAAAFALLAYLYPICLRFFTGVCAILRALPTMAVLLILLVVFRRVEVPVVVGVLTLLPVLFTAYLSALSGVDKSLVEMSKVFGVSARKRVTGLYLPSMKNPLILESAAGFSFSLKLIVSAEILALVAGSLGEMLQHNSGGNAQSTATLFALTLLVCVFCMLVEWVAGLFVKEGV